VRLRAASRQHTGFSLIELISVLVILGIVSAIAASRFFDYGSFEARGFYDQAAALVRYGQKVAIAQHRNVFVNANVVNGTICLTYAADLGCAGGTGVLNPADQSWFSKTAPSGVTITTSVALSFSALGKPSPNAPASLQIVGGGMTRTITVERETGYVH